MEIRTNNHWRPLVYGYELTEKERAEFDYIGADEIDSHEFFRYRGIVYDPSEFMWIDASITPHPQREGWEHWNGYLSDSYFSGILIRYSEDFESIQCATFYC